MTRRYLTAKQKAALWQRQDKRCAECPTPLGFFHADHKNPLWCTGTNDADNWQLLCIRCHAVKTKRESKARAKTKRLEALRLCGRETAKSKMGKVRKLQGRPFGRWRKFNGEIVEAQT